jgi:hypothetical protein
VGWVLAALSQRRVAGHSCSRLQSLAGRL